MADIHVLVGDREGYWTLICHYQVPDVLNQVGVGYRAALIASGLGGSSRMSEGDGPGQIAAAELAQIEAGELYEHAMRWPAESGATNNAELVASARAEYTRAEARVTAELLQRLRYFGWTGSV